MKPLILKIAGLHSFREEQEIAFEQLGELGVFGIFGPTGSGKSSILDAMTLALYGTVVRAGRRTQGILNHAEKQVKVAFTFALGQKSERRCYRVERRYVRKDQLTVTNSYSRLVVLQPEREEVIADKEREVTEQITNLLGLREEDFTRAVVLPQGKFAEFLNLSGKERREMLQRLFSLEQYGNVLLTKINDQYRAVELDYIETESEQKGLGDASPVAVAAAEKTLAAARHRENAALTRFKVAEQQYQGASEVHSLQKDLVNKQLEQAEHRRRENEINKLASALITAEKAARAAAVMEEFFAAKKAEQTAETAWQQVVVKVTQLTNEHKQLSAVAAAARQARLNQEPQLIERRTTLLAARTLEEELTALRDEAAILVQQQQDNQLAFQTASQEASKKALHNQRLADRIASLEQQLDAATISAGWRAQVQAMLALAQTVHQSSLVLDKAKTAKTARQQHVEDSRSAASQAEEQLRQAEQSLCEREATAAKTAAEQRQIAEAKLDQLLAGERQAAAGKLAQALLAGNPCPVCGSVTHPQPAVDRQLAGDVNFEEAITAVREHIASLTLQVNAANKQYTAERKVLNEQQVAAAALTQQAASAQAELDKSSSEVEAAQTALDIVNGQLNAALQAQGIVGPLSPATACKQTAKLSETLRLQDERAESLRKQLNTCRKEQTSCLEEISCWQRDLQTKQAELAALTAKLQSLESLVTAKHQQLVSVTDGLPASQLLARTGQALETIRREEQQAQTDYERVAEDLAAGEQIRVSAETTRQDAVRRRESLQIRFANKLQEEGFADSEAVTKALLSASDQEDYRQQLNEYNENEQRLIAQCEQLTDKLKERSITAAEWDAANQEMAEAEADKNTAVELRVEADKEYRDLTGKYQRWALLETKRLVFKERKDCLQTLKTLLRGNVFIEFLAQEQMAVVAWQASERLKEITQQRYALELNSDGGFLIRDDANGGVRRPVGSLSGGETFQTSLALALALSAQIQLKGKYPLEFFFLDEGFGSLDQQALDVAIATLEKLHIENLTIGIISHVAELKQRMPRRLLVEPAEPAGRGSRVQIEEA